MHDAMTVAEGRNLVLAIVSHEIMSKYHEVLDSGVIRAFTKNAIINELSALPSTSRYESELLEGICCRRNCVAIATNAAKLYNSYGCIIRFNAPSSFTDDNRFHPRTKIFTLSLHPWQPSMPSRGIPWFHALPHDQRVFSINAYEVAVKAAVEHVLVACL